MPAITGVVLWLALRDECVVGDDLGAVPGAALAVELDGYPGPRAYLNVAWREGLAQLGDEGRCQANRVFRRRHCRARCLEG